MPINQKEKNAGYIL